MGEVEVFDVLGAPDHAIVSVRAGHLRKQAAVGAIGKDGHAPFKFSIGPKGVNPFRVELLKPVGTTRLAINPGISNYTVEMKDASAGGAPILVKLVVKDGTGDSSVGPEADDDNEQKFQVAAAAAKEYLDRHRLLQFIRALLQTVVRERPTDPYDFISDQFRKASGAAKKHVDDEAELQARLQAKRQLHEDAAKQFRRALHEGKLTDVFRAVRPLVPEEASAELEAARADARAAVFEAEGFRREMEELKLQLEEHKDALEEAEDARAEAARSEANATKAALEAERLRREIEELKMQLEEHQDAREDAEDAHAAAARAASDAQKGV